MKIYNFHSITKEFLFASDAEKSPLEENVFLVPAHATITPPPICKQNEKAIFQNNQWITVADYRDINYFDKLTGNIVKLKLGEKPDQNLTVKAPPIQDASQFNKNQKSEYIYWNEDISDWDFNIELYKKNIIYFIKYNRLPNLITSKHSILEHCQAALGIIPKTEKKEIIGWNKFIMTHCNLLIEKVNISTSKDEIDELIKSCDLEILLLQWEEVK